jgi:predicted RNase H-like HicB family nuclease
MRHYIAILITEDEGGWSVVFPDFPGCATQGETVDEAIEMAHDALAGHVASKQAHGEKLPEPRTLEQIKADVGFAKEYGFPWSKAMAAPIALRPPLGRPERVTVSLDSNFLIALDAYAERKNLTRSAALTAGGELLMRLDPIAQAPRTRRAQSRKGMDA